MLQALVTTPSKEVPLSPSSPNQELCFAILHYKHFIFDVTGAKLEIIYICVTIVCDSSLDLEL